MRSGLKVDLVAPPGVFRLLLAFTVVLSHIGRFDVGRIAVILFFYLSGYWVSKIWTEKFQSKDVLRFYISRYLRIAPLYLLVMLFAAGALAEVVGPENFTLLGVASSKRDPLGVSWSLDIELQFYLLLPFIAPLLALRSVWPFIGALAAAAAGWLINDRFGVVTVFQYLPAFALGAVTCARRWRPSARTAHLSLAAFIATTAAAYFTPFMDKTVADPFDRDIFGFFWVLPLLPYVARSLTVRAPRLDRDLGNLSFPLYLVHYPIIEGLGQAFGPGVKIRLLAVLIACAAAVALYLGADRIIDRWRVRVTESSLGVESDAGDRR